jgi:hypothetical protein
MANEYESGHVVIPVYSSTGEMMRVAVPGDTPIPEFHAALEDHYHQDVFASQAQPTKEGSVEYSSAFRDAANKALGMARLEESRRQHGSNAGGEAGFSVNRQGSTSPVEFSSDSDSSKGSMRQAVTSNTLAIVHTHDSYHQGDPSQGDVAAARKANTTVYVASRDGLFAVDPGGQITHVFKSGSWATDKNPK